MEESGNGELTDCPKCEGQGRYAGPKDALVRVTCDRCGGSGQVPTDSVSEDDRPATVLKKVPWSRPPRRE
jgi:DnaJ-class molecular chaperone